MVRGVRAVLVILVFLLCVFQAVLVIYESSTYNQELKALAVEGTVSFCINYPPNLTATCYSELNQSTTLESNILTCQLNATGGTNTSMNFSIGGTYSGTNVSYSPVDFSSREISFNLNSSGYLRLYANDSGVGEYYVPIIFKDTSACPIERVYDYNFVIYDINDPPTLSRLLPSKSLDAESTIIPFFLEDYFIDVDGDTMSFAYSAGSSLVISIDEATSRVVITAPEGVCDEHSIYFIATDEHGLSTDSNEVTITVSCEEESSSGGGGSSSSYSCDPEWECRDWSRCYINNSQYRKCVDLNVCDEDDYLRNFWRDCNYTATCYDGVMNGGETGVDCGGPCPACTKEEEKKNETCNDGIKNQNETGVDCGGPCAACKEIEIPSLLPVDEANNFLKIFLIIILVVGAIFVSYFIFRKEIKKTVAKVAWWFTKRKRKQILLNDDEREELLSKIKAIELKAKKIEGIIKASDKLFQDYLKLSELYFEWVLKLKEFSEEDVNKALKTINNRNLANAMKIFIQRHIEFETTNAALDKELVMYYIQDLRQLVFNTAKYDRKDYSFVARPLTIDKDEDPLEKGKEFLYNATVSLEFADINSAKNAYYALLMIYEKLDDDGKELIFYELNKLFNYIKYVISWKELEEK